MTPLAMLTTFRADAGHRPFRTRLPRTRPAFQAVANDVLSPAVTREYWEHRRLAHHGEEGEEKKKQSKKSKIMYGFLTAFLIICLFGCFICMMWPPAYPPYEEYADTVYVTSCPSNGRGNTSMPPPTANASISSTPTEGSLRSSPVGVATDAQMDDAVNANPLSRAQRGVARMTRTGVIFLRRARGARSTRGSEDAVNTFGAAVGRGGVEPGSARGREDVEAVSGKDGFILLFLRWASREGYGRRRRG